MISIPIFHRKISCFKSYLNAGNPVTITINKWLKSTKYQKAIKQIRATTNKTQRDKLKSFLPAITPSGVFSYREEKYLIEHSGLIQFDIDFKENQHISNYPKLKEQLCRIQNVAYCGLSVSGTGFWGLIPIAFPNKHKAHFTALEKEFEKWGIVIDTKPKNVASLRGYSFDKTAYFNPNALPFQLIEMEKPKVKAYVSTKFIPSTTADYTKRKVEYCISEICRLKKDITDGYKNWGSIGCAFASTFGESGRDYFNLVSQYYPEYSFDKTDKQYSQFLKKNGYDYDIAAFFGICKNYGISYMGMFKKK